MIALLAQTNLGTLKGLGPLGNLISGLEAPDAFVKFNKVFSTGIGVLTISAGIWFIIQIMTGSFQWLASGGEKQALQNAQKRISNAILGLFVVIFAYALISIIGLVFGLDILSPIRSLFGIYAPSSLPGPDVIINGRR